MLLKLLLFSACASVCFAGMKAHTPIVIGKARPCLFNDYPCIRKNLAANSRCNPRTSPMPCQYTVKSHRFEAPHFNATYIDRNLIIRGQDRCFVSEFFWNINSDTGVLGIDCPWLNFESDRLLLQHRPLEEDTIYNYRINGTYPLIRLTMSLANADVLDICKEFTFAYVEQLPIFYIDPKDKPTQQFLSKDLSKLNIFERETFLYRANLLARTFINSRLCDFGCN